MIIFLFFFNFLILKKHEMKISKFQILFVIMKRFIKNEKIPKNKNKKKSEVFLDKQSRFSSLQRFKILLFNQTKGINLLRIEEMELFDNRTRKFISFFFFLNCNKSSEGNTIHFNFIGTFSDRAKD